MSGNYFNRSGKFADALEVLLTDEKREYGELGKTLQIQSDMFDGFDEGEQEEMERITGPVGRYGDFDDGFCAQRPVDLYNTTWDRGTVSGTLENPRDVVETVAFRRIRTGKGTNKKLVKQEWDRRLAEQIAIAKQCSEEHHFFLIDMKRWLREVHTYAELRDLVSMMYHHDIRLINRTGKRGTIQEPDRSKWQRMKDGTLKPVIRKARTIVEVFANTVELAKLRVDNPFANSYVELLRDIQQAEERIQKEMFARKRVRASYIVDRFPVRMVLGKHVVIANNYNQLKALYAQGYRKEVSDIRR